MGTRTSGGTIGELGTMHAQSITPENSPAALVPPITPRAPWRVVQVKALDDYRLLVRFADGTEGEVHMKELIHGPNAGVFACLGDAKVFQQVGLEFGAVTWPSGIDLAPDAMYDTIKSHGEWVLK